MVTRSSLTAPEETLKFWDDSSGDGDGDNLSRIFDLRDFEDDMREIDENYEQGSALSIYDGHAYTPAIVKVDDMDIENDRMTFIDSLNKAIHKNRADQEICFEKVTECTVGWFSRSSFKNKLNFMLSLLEDNSNHSFLCLLLHSITLPANSKDLVYSTNQGIGAFEYDVVAEGQNSSMDSSTLRLVQAETRTWFAYFSDMQKLRLVQSMLANSGGAILRRVFLEVTAILNAWELRKKQLNTMKAAGTYYKLAVKYGIEEDALRELPFEVLELEHNLILDQEQEEERVREEMEAMAKKESKKEKQEKGKGKGKGKKDKDADQTEEKKVPKEKEEKKVVESSVSVDNVKKEEHPLDLAAREMNGQFEQALEKLRLAFKVDEHGRQYPAPPPPVEEVEKNGKKDKKNKGEKEEKDEKSGKKGKKEKDGKKEGDKNAKEKKEKPGSKGKKKGSVIDVDAGVDQIQLLPLTLNRGILRMLGEKQLKSLKQVSGYWARMVDDITGEMKARKMIDDAVRKIGEGTPSKPDKGSKKSSKKGEKGKKGKKKKGPTRSSSKSTKSTKSSKSSKSAKSVKSRSTEAHVEVTSRVAAAQGQEATLAAFGGTEDLTSNHYYTNRCLRVNVACRFFGGRVTAQSVDGHMFASSNARREIEFYSLRSGAQLPYRLSGHDRCITCMACLEVQGTEYLVTGSKDKSARLWNVPLLTSERTYLGHTDAVTGVAACETLLATTGADKMARVCDLRSGMHIMSAMFEQAPSALCLSADPPQIFLGFPSGDITVYNVDTKVPVFTVAAHDGEVTCFHLAPPVLASGGADKVARLWSVVDFSNSCLTAFSHASAVCCVQVSRQQLVVANLDATFTVWNIVSGTQLKMVRLPSACHIVNIAVYVEPDYARVLVSSDVAVHAYEFHLHGSLRGRSSSRARSHKVKIEQARPKTPKVHFEEGACLASACTGLPITSQHPPYHRTTRQEEREKLRKLRGFPESGFFQEIQGVPMHPPDFLHELLNYDQMEAECTHALRLFPQAVTTEKEVPGVPRYPPVDPNAAREPDPKYKLRRTGRLEASYKNLLQMYNARYPTLDF